MSGNSLSVAPAGIAGGLIDLALGTPDRSSDSPVHIVISDAPSDWVFSSGTRIGDGTWVIDTSDPASLTVTTPSTFAGAAVLQVSMTWLNADATFGWSVVSDNIEVFSPGSPIFAVSSDDHLTASSAADLFVFAQPIANDMIHSFDAAADSIDLIGFAGVTGSTTSQSPTTPAAMR